MILYFLLLILCVILAFGVYLILYFRPFCSYCKKPVSEDNNFNTNTVEEVSEEEKAKNKIVNVSNKDIIKLAVFLTVLGIICAGLLALVNSVTAPIIEKNKSKELEKTLEVINVKNPVVLDDVVLLEGVDQVYEGTINGTDCYVFQTTIKNSYTTITTLFVVSKSDKKIVEVAPIGANLTTHSFDKDILESNFGLIGTNSTNFESSFEVVAGASRSSDSIINGAKLVFEQLIGMEG